MSNFTEDICHIICLLCSFMYMWFKRQFGVDRNAKNGNEMFYHLFQSRLKVFNDLFFLKSASILL